MPPPTGSAPLPAPPGPDAPWRPVGGADREILARLLGQGRWVPLQARPERTAYRVDVTGGTVFAKHYTPGGRGARLQDFWLRRKPQRALSLGRRLGNSGVPTPEPLGLYALGRGLWREALLVSRWVGPTRKWSVFLAEEAPRGRSREAFREGVLGLARLLGSLHRLGFYHGDLSGNLVFGREGDAWRPYLVDLEDLHRHLPRRRRVKNLEELGRGLSDLTLLTLRDRWEFLREYGRAAALDLGEPRRLWREARDAQRRRRRGR